MTEPYLNGWFWADDCYWPDYRSVLVALQSKIIYTAHFKTTVLAIRAVCEDLNRNKKINARLLKTVLKPIKPLQHSLSWSGKTQETYLENLTGCTVGDSDVNDDL